MQCSKNKLKTFLQQEARAFGNNIGKEPQKATPKIDKIYIHSEYLFCPQPNASSSFLITCINFVEQRLKKWFTIYQA